MSHSKKMLIKTAREILILTPSGKYFGENIIVLVKNKSVVKTQSVLILQSRQNETAEVLYSSVLNGIWEDLDYINVFFMFYFYHINP